METTKLKQHWLVLMKSKVTKFVAGLEINFSSSSTGRPERTHPYLVLIAVGSFSLFLTSPLTRSQYWSHPMRYQLASFLSLLNNRPESGLANGHNFVAGPFLRIRPRGEGRGGEGRGPYKKGP